CHLPAHSPDVTARSRHLMVLAASPPSANWSPQGLAPADGSGVLRRHGPAGGTRDAELRAVSAGGDLARMRAAPEKQGAAVTERLGATVGEVVAEFQSEAIDRKSTRLNSSHLGISY